MGLKPVSVAQLNNYIRRVLSTDPILGNVSVIGEISNLKFHSSGHVYFSLKDESSKVNCFLAGSNLDRISCVPEEGMEVIATGYVSVYERGGYYSLNIRELEVNGAGQLAVQFEKLKAKLEKEGLFDREHKKELPEFPKNIAVVTSETGAAVRDIIKTIRNKNDYVDIFIYPVLVQGPAAAADIAGAIDDLNANHPEMDVIITGRGGGSMEELWAFNEEVVARSIYASRIPVISAVGHETDFTIADFVADLRAETPTAAAERAVPDMGEIREYLTDLRDELKDLLVNRVEYDRNRLEALNPEAFLQGITGRIGYEQLNIDNMMESMTDMLKNLVSSSRQRVEGLHNIILASDPKIILSRGYAVVTDENGEVVSDAGSLKKGQQITIEAGAGSASAEVLSSKRSK